MRPLFSALSVVALLAVAGCSTNDSSNYDQGPMLGAITPSSSDCTDPTKPDCDGAPADGTQVANTPPPSQMVTAGVSNLDISTFTDSTGFKAMDSDAQSQAGSAQYYALQFGRVGAPRNWIGDKGQSGAVTVGPYVRVNLIDCRDFTNTVTINGQTFTKKGTACREADGSWTVTATKTG